MKVLIIRMYPNTLNINNYNVQEIGLAKALINKGHQCDIVLYTKKDENYQQEIIINEKQKITIYWQKGKNFLKNVIYNKEICDIIHKYDIIQLSEYDQIQNLKLIKKINKPFVIYHGPYYNKFNRGYNIKCRIFDNLFLKFNKWYLQVPFISKSKLASEFLTNKGFSDISTIGVGLDTGNIDNTNLEIINKEIDDLVERKGNKKYLLYIGKIEERRNIKFLFDLLHNIYQDRQDINLVLIGKGDNKYVKECFDYAKEKNVMQNIIYIPSIKQNEISKIYSNSEVFLLPTEYEIFGMVLLEAMYFGMPTITTLNGGSSTIIENGKNGYICDNKEINKWKHVIYSIINDKEELYEIKYNAKNTIQERYVWDKIVDDFIDVYTKAIRDKK